MNTGSHRTKPVQAIAWQRRKTLLRFDRLKARHGNSQAARMVGAGVVTLWRWRQRYNRHGLAGLNDRFGNCGPRSPFSKIRLTAAAVRELEAAIARTGQPRKAWLQLSRRHDVSPRLARHLQQHGGKPPGPLREIGKIVPVAARAWLSADSRRAYISIPAHGTIPAKIFLPAGFRPQALKAPNKTPNQRIK